MKEQHHFNSILNYLIHQGLLPKLHIIVYLIDILRIGQLKKVNICELIHQQLVQVTWLYCSFMRRLQVNSPYPTSSIWKVCSPHTKCHLHHTSASSSWHNFCIYISQFSSFDIFPHTYGIHRTCSIFSSNLQKTVCPLLRFYTLYSRYADLPCLSQILRHSQYQKQLKKLSLFTKLCNFVWVLKAKLCSDKLS